VFAFTFPNGFTRAVSPTAGRRPKEGSLSQSLRRLALSMMAVTCGLAAPALASAKDVQVQVYLTDANLKDAALTQEPDALFSGRSLPRGVKGLNVDDHIRYQSIVGFGAAMTDSSAYLIHNYLSPGQRKTVLDGLFSARTGLGIDFLRVPIGGSDFTAGGTAYTYDDLPEGQTDPTLADFSVAHDLGYVIPTLQQTMKVNPAVDVISTEWTAPAWMKANDSTADLGRAGSLLSPDYAVLAQYFVKFIEAYKAAGIPIWAITPENEPGTPVSYPSMNLTPAQEAQFIAQDLAPAFQAAGISSRIYGGDTGSAEPSYATAVQSDSASAAAVSGEAWHCYGGQEGITAFHNAFPGVQNLMTECSPGIIPYTGAEASIDAIRNWASSATLWNVALNSDGGPVQAPNEGCGNCTGLVTINQGTHKVTKTDNYYQLGQLSKFVERGAVRIDTPRWVHDYRDTRYHVSAGLDNVAFLNPDGSRVLVAYDNSSHPITFGVSWNYQQFSYTLNAGATVTFKWTGNEPHDPVNAVARCFNSGVRYVSSGSQIVAKPDC
jgi:glucosylceramidase